MRTNTGYIALIGTIIISSILLTIVLESSYAGYFSRFNILRTENKAQSYELAQSCLQVALIRLAENPNYRPVAGGDRFFIEDDSCKILSIQSNDSGILIIQTTAVIQKAVSNIESSVTLSDTSLSINSTKEVPNF